MKYLHTMVRISNVEASLEFFCEKLGMVEIYRYDSKQGRFTNLFLAAPQDLETTENHAPTERAPCLELTYNWDVEPYDEGRNFGHLAFAVDNIYQTCEKLISQGVTINRPPRDGRMAFIRSPDNISIELLQKDEALEPIEPWTSMQNIGHW